MSLAIQIRSILHTYGVHSATIQPEFTDDHHTDEKYMKDDDSKEELLSSTCLLRCSDNSCIENTCCPHE